MEGTSGRWLCFFSRVYLLALGNRADDRVWRRVSRDPDWELFVSQGSPGSRCLQTAAGEERS